MAWLCDAPDVSGSGLHAWLSRSPSAHARHDDVLATSIDRSFKSSDRTYGARRVWHDVLAEGLSCWLHRIEWIMREHGLRARPRRRGLPKDVGVRAAASDDLLDRTGGLHLHPDCGRLAVFCSGRRPIAKCRACGVVRIAAVFWLAAGVTAESFPTAVF